MNLGKGYKYQNKDVVYITFKKHFCPHCNAALKTSKVKKKVNRNSPEGKNFDWNFGSPGHKVSVDEATFVWKEFVCPNCNAHFSVKEMQKHEGVYIEETSETVEQDRKANTRGKIIFFAIGFVVLIIVYLIENYL